MKKAYENRDFLRSHPARPLRILAEYLEPHSRMKRHGIRRAITFWGSARIRQGQDEIGDGRDYFTQAGDLGRLLAKWTMEEHPMGRRYHILTGGGPGIMEAAQAGAATVNRMLNVGFNIALPFEQKSNPYIPEQQVFEFQYFFMRKFWFLNLARALVVFPGGFGTLDELFEVLTLIQTRKASKRPVILFGESYWQEVINLPALARQGLIDESDLALVEHVDSVEHAFSCLVDALQA